MRLPRRGAAQVSRELRPYRGPRTSSRRTQAQCECRQPGPLRCPHAAGRAPPRGDLYPQDRPAQSAPFHARTGRGELSPHRLRIGVPAPGTRGTVARPAPGAREPFASCAACPCSNHLCGLQPGVRPSRSVRECFSRCARRQRASARSRPRPTSPDNRSKTERRPGRRGKRQVQR